MVARYCSDRLKLAKRAAELHPLAGIAGGHVEHRLQRACDLLGAQGGCNGARHLRVQVQGRAAGRGGQAGQIVARLARDGTAMLPVTTGNGIS